MKNINTEIIIEAPAHIIWSHLTDFSSYPQWNSFIQFISGDLKQGAQWTVTIAPPGGKKMSFSPKCTKLISGRHLQWEGNLVMKGLFDGEHIFLLDPIDDERTLFIQKENFSGILVSLLWKSMYLKTLAGFNLMNQQMKELAESSAWKKIN
ncbi:MAG: SRPBCC domain-containing protein [Saprospiraceae bacterium]